MKKPRTMFLVAVMVAAAALASGCQGLVVSAARENFASFLTQVVSDAVNASVNPS